MPGEFARILCPVDFSEASLAAYRKAASLARSTRAEIVLAHAFDLPEKFTYDAQQTPADPHEREKLDQIPPPSPDIKITRVLHAGAPGEVICWLAQQHACDLIVMGTHGRSGLMHLLLGSVAEYVLRHARCPVLTVRERPPNEPPLKEPVVLPPKAPRLM